MSRLRIWWLAVLISLALSSMARVHATEGDVGIVEGQIVWADGNPVTNCKVKLVDKLEFYDVPSIVVGTPTVKRFRIASDAWIRETEVDSQGRFRFDGVPAGTYYFFWHTRDSAEGDKWVYQHTHPAGVYGYVLGFMPEPDKHQVRKGITTKIPDVKLEKKKE